MVFKTKLIGQKDIEETFNRILEENQIPHLFITGSHGSGKTTLLKEFVNTYYKKYNIKNTSEWMNKTNPPYLDIISAEFIEKYLTHESEDLIRRLTVQDTFLWKKGSLNAADRKRFHCSSNFTKNGVVNKKAIIAWSTIPKELVS